MKKYFLVTLILTSLTLPTLSAVASSRIDAVMSEDTTVRLENIAELKGNIRSFKLQISTLEIALEEAKTKKSRKKLYNNSKKIADAITALTILSGAIAAYRFENKINVLKVASFVGGLSSSVSVISGLLADMSTDEVEAINTKIGEIKPILKATETNLAREVKYLCGKEPSNQMCR